MSIVKRDASGYALVIVLWVLAGLTVVAVAVAGSVYSNAQSVKLLRDRVVAERAFLDASSRIKVIGYRAVGVNNRLFGPRGELYVDGRETVAGEGGDTVVMQDINGLVALRADSVRLAGLLPRCGIPTDSQAALLDSLADYVDADGLKRLNGAEAFEYSKVGRPEPRNAPLLSRDELLRVLGWDAFGKAWQEARCDEWVSARGLGRMNRFTAPLAVLQADGLTAEQALALREAREAGVALGPGPNAEIGSARSPMLDESTGIVAPVVRISHRLPSVQWMLQYELEFTQSEPGGPWQTHELRIVPSLAPDSAVKATLPPIDYRLPEQDRARLNALSASPFNR
jgi:general secretion pathway protein K